jgi:hypothetical protein
MKTLQELIDAIEQQYKKERDECDSLAQINRLHNREKIEIVEEASRLFPGQVRELSKVEALKAGVSTGEGPNGGTFAFQVGEKIYSFRTGMLV